MAKSVVVVGAGITGVSAAEWLRRDGWTVTLVDRVLPGSPDQTSFGNAGILARSAILPVSVPGLWAKGPGMLRDPDAPLFLRWRYLPQLLPWLIPFLRNGSEARVRTIASELIKITDDSVDQHQSLAAGTPAAKFIRTGEFIRLYPDQSDYKADPLAIAVRKAHGFDPHHIHRPEIIERDPHLGPRYTFGTVIGNYGWIDSPGDYVAALFNHFRSQGGSFVQGEAAAIAPGDAPAVTLVGGQALRADKVVLTAGAWSGRLAASLGLRVQVEAERGYHLSMFGANIAPPTPYMITDAKFVVTPMAGCLRAAGIVEFGGLDAPASDAPLALLRRQMKQVYPGLTFEREETWMGRRPSTPDSLPLLGEAAGRPNVLHAYGGQHVGLTIGPKLGRMIADLAGGRSLNIDVSAFDAGRFQRSSAGRRQ